MKSRSRGPSGACVPHPHSQPGHMMLLRLNPPAIGSRCLAHQQQSFQAHSRAPPVHPLGWRFVRNLQVPSHRAPMTVPGVVVSPALNR